MRVCVRVRYVRVGRLTPGVGTAEYSALKWFAAIVPLYYFAWVGISSFIISFYFSVSSSARDVLRQYGNNPVWYPRVSCAVCVVCRACHVSCACA